MLLRRSPRFALSLVAILAASLGCDGGNTSGNPALGDSPAGQPAAAAEPGYLTGRIVRADGSPITTPGVKFSIIIAGVTGVGENNTFRPDVAADGTFKLKLPPGYFKPAEGQIIVPFEGQTYSLWLHPVNSFEGTRESTPGIRQDFVWRLTGPRPNIFRDPSPNTAGDWYGSLVPMSSTGFRNDIMQPVKPLTAKSKIVFTFTPTSRLVDGSEAKPVTLERTLRMDGEVDGLCDLPPASYEVSAVATLPDGTTKLLLMQDEVSTAYEPTARVTLIPGILTNHYEYLPQGISWAVE